MMFILSIIFFISIFCIDTCYTKLNNVFIGLFASSLVTSA